MKRRFLALTLALVMVVGLLPVLGVSADDQVDNRLDLHSATQNNTFSQEILNYYQASTDDPAVKFDVDESDKYTATLSGTMARSNSNFAALNFRDLFTSATNLDEHVTQTVTITDMPIFTDAQFGAAYTACGYFNVLTRNYNGATVGEDSTKQDYILYSIFRKDEEGNLGLRIYNPTLGATATQEVTAFAEKMGVAFTLTTVWHADSKVSFYCDGESLGTFDNVAYASTSNGGRREYLSIGYLCYADDNNPSNVNLTVSDVKISHGHTVAADDGDCTTEVACSVCGAVTTPAKNAHSFDRKVPAEAYKKADGEYYLSCACGTSSAGTLQEATFTVMELYSATQSTTHDNTILNYYVASTDDPAVKFAVAESDKYTATLSGTMARSNSSYAALNFKDTFTSATNVDEHVTQTVTITDMPIFTNAQFGAAYTACGYFNVLTRNYSAATVGADSSKQDYILYSIYRKDEEGNLGLRIYNPTLGATATQEVTAFAEKMGVPFTLTTVWHAGSKVSFYCDGESLGTFENVAYASTSNGGRREYLSIGYLNYPDSTNPSNVNLTVSNVQIAHAHEGGTATCKELAECAICGAEYGNLGGHVPAADDGDCTTDILCSVCGEVLTPGQPHNYNKRVPADAYKKADTEREYYLSCVCGATSKGTAYEATYTVFDLYPATQSDQKTADNYYTLTDPDDTAVFSVSGHTARLSGLMTAGASARTSLNFKNAFGAAGVDDHLSQTICITTLPITSTKVATTRVARGYYNVLTRNYDTEANTIDHLMYSIIRTNNEGNLQLNVFTSVADGSSAEHTISLGKKLGDTFVLTTVWEADDGVTFYVDGSLLATYESVTHTYTGDSAFYESLTLGVNCKAAAADSDLDGDETLDSVALDLTISNVHLSHGHSAADDGDCMTADVCYICGVEFNEAKDAHVQAEDDGNCATAIKCSNPGCEYVFVEGDELTHFDRVAPTDTEDGKKEYWYCAAHNRFFLNADGTSEVEEADLTIPKLIQIVDDKAEVSTESLNNAINGAGENVALDVPTSKVELPAGALDALEDAQKDLVISGKDGVKVTLNQGALTQINIDSDGSALTIEVKAGASLQDGQQAAMEGYGTVKDVVSATMFAGDVSITDFGSGTVTIEIPFEMDAGTQAGDYKLYYVPDEGEPQEITSVVFANGKMTAILEHFSEYAIVSTVVEPVEGNATITVNGGSSVATVTGTYVDGLASGDVFSVDVEWDNLSFNYMAADTWDPETHTNTGGGWEENVTGSVTVTNHSNIAVTVTVTKEDIGTEKGLGVNFVGASTDNLDAGTPENVGAADYCVVEFAPKGTLVEGDTDVTLATITVTITKYDPQN